MDAETKNCQNCKQDFRIDPEDFDFYKKIDVPPPTFCPECRFYRRMSWRNEWHVFKKRDTHTGKEVFSLFPEESPVKIYEKEYWLSDAWDPMSYGRDYDFSRSFFDQYRDLYHAVPIPAHSILNLVNCEYCANATDLKNCYLVRAATKTEDSAYLIWDHASKFCFDSHMTTRCELGYGNQNAANCYKTFFSVDCDDCQEVTLCMDCVGCNNCFGSFGLRNKSYYIFNEPYSKKEYLRKLAELNLGSRRSFSELQEKVYAHWKKYPHKFMHGRQNTNVSGDYIYNSKNAKQCYRVRDAEDVKFCQNILQGTAKDCYDYNNWGQNSELMYEALICGNGGNRIRFSYNTWPSVRDLEYCVFCQNSSDLFGCVSVRNKQYCILNRQYPKEEYFALRKKIIEQMSSMPFVSKSGQVYSYGEFFPPEFAPIPYQTSFAYEFAPLSDEEAAQRGFSAYLVNKQTYRITLKAAQIPDDIKEAENGIINEVIECAHEGKCQHECVNAFRIIDRELEFCKRMNLPLPRLCPNCRHYARLVFRTPPQMWGRECMKCDKAIQTSYSPDRPEIVYCEQCYNAEVV